MADLKKGRISDIAIRHLGVIFAEHKGAAWAPVNGDAKLLMVKGAPKGDFEVKGSKTFMAKLAETFKAVFGPVSSDAIDDNIDPAMADFYNNVCSLVANLYYDVSAAWGIADDEARSIACCAAIDNFIESLDQLRGVSKAKVDTEKLKSIAATALAALGIEPPESLTTPAAAVSETKAVETDAITVDLSAPGTVTSPATDPAKGAPATQPVTVNGVSAEDVAKAVSEAVSGVKAEMQTAIKTAVDAAKAAAKTETDALQTQLETANAALAKATADNAQLTKKAREPGSQGFVETTSTNGKTSDPASGGQPVERAAAAATLAKGGSEGGPATIGDAVRLARIANGG